ncbi:2OG-Fe(II) oxygenase superfamily protein [Andreprevotia lacus DSM 23236]|jgi:hypothetical protein|uniref:2OG-Fe(II) oxygenase superfamily protein n=1 Tax=Andreprevotia lacus DSM 23236 TaxID=1121001 RepID=A0A1W1X704_9NEIS|nr:2OG-Fe(II) oxygenase [Andreprevotia lacus]SMC19603.1 2OG-Fe(II) oxygenase superfamily protein [Andreprevotia lacus DSM 23236]
MEITDYGDGIFTVAHFLSPAECDHYITLGEQIGFDESEISTRAGSVMDKAIRNNDRVLFDDTAMAARLFAQARGVLPLLHEGWMLQGFNERMRFYRYGPNEYFRWHRDGSFVRTVQEASQLTFMIYLNEAYTGGSTDFRTAVIQPRQGMALCFPHRLMHQGAPVLSGSKYVLRTDVMYRLPVASGLSAVDSAAA